ncbi:response regulator transcription factor [Chryseobacterium oryctis]|uniref:Helix-turn-helix transcriptional regulator n=1 Tax=Chryseobacterium oryctis TaxID=2952618 RepID=A0ABT3HPC5_9FLAO|nr:helix-turn-helix transcriptional regulator [Chryseobacterium oryctis]MCW3161640.1 helix-turn-helix transcriptional regulator [Chryseobacterium oryctis]
MDEIKKFFSEKNEVNGISDFEIKQTGDYLEIVKAFARITYQSLYIIDYEKKSFEYVSENPLFLCGLSPEEVRDLGYAFYFRNVLNEDQELLLKINEVGFEFYDKLPFEERKMYTISYDFHIVNDKKNVILINHKLTPMFLTQNGKIWKAMCIVSLSSTNSAGNISITKENSDIIWKYNLDENRWIKEEKKKLSQRELEIISLYASGLTINEIASKIFVSADTVKFHRRKLFEKIGVNNITEALAYAKNNKLL